MIKSLLIKIYTCTLNSPIKTNYYQRIARDVEWNAIKQFIKKGKFLDIGAGAGYSMLKAQNEFNCEVFGIDPKPFDHGVGRVGSEFNIGLEIKTGVAEQLPFDDKFFDIVYCSHVLEHIQDISKSLNEIKRVLNYDGIIIIGVPSSTMAYLNWISQLIFTTHIKIVNLMFSKFINTGKIRWWELFIPSSHSYPNKTIIYDIYNYRVKVWEKMIAKEFKIIKIVKPALYPYPEYRQLFKLKISKKISSSIFFICKK